MADLLVLLLLSVTLGSAIRYIIKEKRAGARCIGCSMAGVCSKKTDTANPLVMKYRQEFGK